MFVSLFMALVLTFGVILFSPPSKAVAQSVGESGRVSDYQTGTAVWFNYPTDPATQKPRRQVPALIKLNMSGETVQGYCIEARVGMTSLGAELELVEWGNYGGVSNIYPNTENLLNGPDAQDRREKINWIVHNSYPYVQPDDLGISGVSVRDALAGTQAAIWHFSDDMNFTFTRSDQKDVQRVYEWLTGPANTGRPLDDRIGVGGLPLEGRDQDVVAVPEDKPSSEESTSEQPSSEESTSEQPSSEESTSEQPSSEESTEPTVPAPGVSTEPTTTVTTSERPGVKPEPGIRTSAEFKDGSQVVQNGATVVDTVHYTDLVAGKNYTLNAKLVDKQDADNVLGTGAVTFEAPGDAGDLVSGSVKVEIAVTDAEAPVQAAVAFERLTSTEVNAAGEETDGTTNDIAEHEDIDDEDQTVRSVFEPRIATNAKFGDGSTQVVAGSTVIDTVDYEGLVPGKEYTLSAKLMERIGDEAPYTEGRVLGEGTKTFTPESTDGSVEVAITVNDDVTEPVAAAVAFEELTSTEVDRGGNDNPQGGETPGDFSDDNEIAEHKDINDANQTVEGSESSESLEEPTSTPGKERPWWLVLIPGIGLIPAIVGDGGDSSAPEPAPAPSEGESGSAPTTVPAPARVGNPVPADSPRTVIKQIPSGGTVRDGSMPAYI